MKRFFIIISLFTLFIIFGWSIILSVYEQIAYSNTNIHPYKRINFVTNYTNKNPDLIILGNSRAEDSYDDSILSAKLNIKCANLGWAGYPFDYQYNVMWKTYIKSNSYPKYIILEVGPWAFLDYVNPIYTIELLPYIDREEFNFLFSLSAKFSRMDKFIFYKYRGKIINAYLECLKLCNTEETKQESSKRWNSDYFNKLQKIESNPQILSLLDDFIDECQANNIILIVSCSPIHGDALRYFRMDAFWKIINERTNKKNIKTLNYQNLYGNDTIMFENPMHLNRFGKKLFSLKIAHDIDSIIINQ